MKVSERKKLIAKIKKKEKESEKEEEEKELSKKVGGVFILLYNSVHGPVGRLFNKKEGELIIATRAH